MAQQTDHTPGSIEEIRKRIQSSLVQSASTTDDDKFMPRGTLEAILDPGTIRKVISSIKPMDAGLERELALEVASRGAIGVLGILIYIGRECDIAEYLAHHIYDARLPMGGLDFEVPKAEDFLENQYKFLAPRFESGSHEALSARVPLPFISDENVDSGSYGNVRRVEIHPTHHGFTSALSGSDKCLVARKVLFLDDTAKNLRAAFERERRNLRLINYARHNSIIELLCTFSHGQYFNFLFPHMDQNLQDFLGKESRPELLRHDGDIFRAMLGLAQALELIHHNEVRGEDWEMRSTGFHHDLKPANILVKGGTFVITDFGFARIEPGLVFRNPVFWKGGLITYIPQEVDLKNRNDKLDACAVDVWSLGCILLEVIVYTVQGCHELASFRKRRITRDRNTTDDLFHQGLELKVQVKQQMDAILQDKNGAGAAHDLLKLCARLLNPHPAERRKVRTSEEIAAILRQHPDALLSVEDAEADLTAQGGEFNLHVSALKGLDDEFAQELDNDRDGL